MTETRPIEHLFGELIELETVGERQEYLEKACGDDQLLRAQLEKLLASHQRAGSFMGDRDNIDMTTGRAEQAEKDRIGSIVGPYKLLQKIGEGGMGVVYMANQTQPVKRRVALKIIKPGMDTRQVIARFEAERQALAMMDHPNIAKVLDAGITDSDRPYFVMELVKGIPIDEYCDEHNLSPKERLELFIPVCHALQHAHHKGVVHRDIKPSNVLVAEFDNHAVPKVIDFGIAKAVDQQLTERTVFTQFGQVIGTPEYMSPEQAKMNQLDVDTRSDIYSLGVLLYELLTGTTPFDKQRLRSVAFEELLRIIREEEPPRPSVRLSTVDKLPTVATHRKTEPKKLSLLLRGELDWIVMKALDKERSRRYDSANALADDVQRHLSGDAVIACPPSKRYLLSKFASRNKTAITTSTVVLLTLLLGIIGTTSMAVVASRERAKAVAALTTAETQRQRAEDALAALLDQLVETAFLTVMSGDIEHADPAIESARLAGASPATVSTLEGLAELYRGNLDRAIELTRHATEIAPTDYSAWAALRLAYSASGQSSMAYGTHPQMRAQGIDPMRGYRNDYELLMTIQAHHKPMDQLDDLIRRRPTWAVAKLARASLLAGPKASREDLDRAIEYVRLARAVLPATRLVLSTELWIHTSVLGHVDDPSWDTADSRELAEAAANALDQHPKYSPGRLVRMLYFRQLGKHDLEKKELDAAIELGHGGWWTKAVDFYRKNDLQHARLLLEREPSLSDSLFLAFVQAEDNRETALQTYRDLVRRPDSHSLIRFRAVAVPLLVGESLQDIRSELMTITFPNPDQPHLDRQFLLGEIDDAAYLDGCKLPWSQQHAHYWIGLLHLNQGEREKAKEHFREACKNFYPGWFPCHWSQAFLERLESDPDWPARIQGRQKQN